MELTSKYPFLGLSLMEFTSKYPFLGLHWLSVLPPPQVLISSGYSAPVHDNDIILTS